METIEITTTQNVVIQYTLASLGQRIVAYMIDVLVIFGSILLFSIGGGALFESELIYYFISLPIFLFYTLTLEYFLQGQTLGKKVVDLKVIRSDGDEPTLEDLVTRWAFRMIDIYFSFGALASFLIHSTEKKQRLGGLVSGTTVVKVRPDRIVRISDLMKLENRDDREIEFPEIAQFSEEQMITIKQTLLRYKKYPNEAHREVLFSLYKKVADKLGLSPDLRTAEQVVGFLRNLINDYVVLTR